MSESKYYNVAGHLFGVSGEAKYFTLMQNYEPFSSSPESGEVRRGLNNSIFSLAVERGEAPVYAEELRQEEEGQIIVCGKTDDGLPVFEFIWWGTTAGWLISSTDYHEGRLVTTGHHTKMAIDNALMIMFALATASENTALFHAAVVSYKGRGYMFLGPSGTGKSTHARLWLQHVEGTALVNDDNPVVCIGKDGSASVYGSPWSGKTPCYRNVSYPLGGIVVLSQAPYNKINRLNGIHAYATLVESISGMRWDSHIAEGLHLTENVLASTVPVWHLECLPDEEAAILCNETITQ